ncbi:MAG: hypothetical protein RR769_07185 [Anaerovoracaceae bacterium]
MYSFGFANVSTIFLALIALVAIVAVVIVVKLVKKAKVNKNIQENSYEASSETPVESSAVESSNEVVNEYLKGTSRGDIKEQIKAEESNQDKSFFQKVYTDNRPQAQFFRNMADKEVDKSLNMAKEAYETAKAAETEGTPSVVNSQGNTAAVEYGDKKKSHMGLIIGAVILVVIIAIAYHLLSGAADYSAKNIEEINVEPAGLTSLNLFGYESLEDISGLDQFTTLDTLFIPELSINSEDLAVFDKMPKLNKLDMNGCRNITNLDGLKTQTNLENLNLEKCKGLMDISGIRDCKNMKILNLNKTSIVDLSPLKDMKNLTEISLVGIKATDFSPLYDLENLVTITADEENQEAVAALRENIKGASVNHFTYDEAKENGM